MDFALANYEKVILSTDIPVAISDYYGNKRVIVITRPDDLCHDHSEMRDVVQHAIKYTETRSGYLWLLQPTSPFRESDDVGIIRSLINSLAPKSVISVTHVGANHPERMYTINHGKLWNLRKANFENKQQLKDVYIRNGCYYVVDIESFLDCKTFYFKRDTIPYIMDKSRSMNIDDSIDLHFARSLL